MENFLKNSLEKLMEESLIFLKIRWTHFWKKKTMGKILKNPPVEILEEIFKRSMHEICSK